ncbi:hypothetical protein [Maribacter sp. ACAM166]|uniref:hypothetical protein n=1 Tax=Maribacter sp. ACAM166 TaxID=2508996 RepID=UPI0010FF32D2|nr:hypothetical protein [Maribacter sp. ACAM166]TLP73131.1 hypothetical protein ES765_17535 [Maribacter sp. ACAM166]
MKKNFLKFILSICILLFSVCSPLFGNFNIENSSFHTVDNQNIVSAITLLKTVIHDQNTTIKGSSDEVVKVLEIDAAEIEEEESENSVLKKGEEVIYTTGSFYLLSLLFLFSYLKNSSKLQRLFTFSPIAIRRFVLFQVFRI